MGEAEDVRKSVRQAGSRVIQEEAERSRKAHIKRRSALLLAGRRLRQAHVNGGVQAGGGHGTVLPWKCQQA